jgi:hypothetical protein
MLFSSITFLISDIDNDCGLFSQDYRNVYSQQKLILKYNNILKTLISSRLTNIFKDSFRLSLSVLLTYTISSWQTLEDRIALDLLLLTKAFRKSLNMRSVLHSTQIQKIHTLNTDENISEFMIETSSFASLFD